jgi:hypothetical protein
MVLIILQHICISNHVVHLKYTQFYLLIITQVEKYLEDIAILSMYAPNNRATKYVKKAGSTERRNSQIRN